MLHTFVLRHWWLHFIAGWMCMCARDSWCSCVRGVQCTTVGHWHCSLGGTRGLDLVLRPMYMHCVRWLLVHSSLFALVNCPRFVVLLVGSMTVRAWNRVYLWVWEGVCLQRTYDWMNLISDSKVSKLSVAVPTDVQRSLVLDKPRVNSLLLHALFTLLCWKSFVCDKREFKCTDLIVLVVCACACLGMCWLREN